MKATLYLKIIKPSRQFCKPLKQLAQKSSIEYKCFATNTKRSVFTHSQKMYLCIEQILKCQFSQTYDF